MIVFTHVFLILLAPLVVQGAPTTSSGTADSGNRDPAHLDHQINTNLAPLSDLILGPIDKHLHPVILGAGSKYSIRGGSIEGPVPADDYYRVPSFVLIDTPEGNHQLPPDQVVRLSNANIDQSRIDAMRATLDRGHNIHVPVLHVPLKPTNDRTLHAIVVPVESKCHDLDKQETSDIPPGQYFQAPQKAVIFSPVMGVIFGEAPGRVVRILDNVNIETLKSYATECGQSYDHKLAMLRARGEHPRFTRGVYVKDCKHYIWNHAVTKEGPVPFLAPVLLAQ